jgi:AraC-like DNA-binding protein
MTTDTRACEENFEAGSTSPAFHFFNVDQQLGRFVSYLYSSSVPHSARTQWSGYRVPEVAPQVVFIIEDGRAFPSGLALGSGLSASLFVQPAHISMELIPDTLRVAVGASLRAEGLRLLVPGGACELGRDLRIPLEELWGRQGRELLERLAAESSSGRLALLRAVLTERALASPPPNPTVSRAVRLIEGSHGDVSLDEVAAICGVTTRTLHTVITREVGLAPKLVARIARVRRAIELVQARTGSLSAISLASAFADQAHLSREFRQLLGTTPRAISRRIHAKRPMSVSERDLLSTGLLLLPRDEEAHAASAGKGRRRPAPRGEAPALLA